MSNFIGEYQYAIAWALYLGSGAGFCFFWWKVTSRIRHAGWRDLLRGLSLVLIYTPWYADPAHEHFAPAVIVLLVDFLPGSTGSGLAVALTLLAALAAMLGVLVLKRLRRPL